MGVRRWLGLRIVERVMSVGFSTKLVRYEPLVVCGVLIVGAAGAFVALRGPGSQDAFMSVQSASPGLGPQRVLSGTRVAAEVAKEPEPVPAARRTPAAQALCRPKGGGTLRNPWVCTVRYRSRTEAHYLVEVEPDGSYSGVGTGLISGCCVKVSTLE